MEFILGHWKLIALSILLVLSLLFVKGCGGYNDMLKKIPDASFESFSYHRGGNVTSAQITATNATIDDNTISIENIDIALDYGPLVNFKLNLKGYQRQLQADIPD